MAIVANQVCNCASGELSGELLHGMKGIED
jgi:hypothetical protein